MGGRLNVAHTAVSLNVTSCDLRPISIANLQVVRGYRKCSCLHGNEWNACLAALEKSILSKFFTFHELVNPWEDENNHYCRMNVSRLLLLENIAYSDPEFKNEFCFTLYISTFFNTDLKDLNEEFYCVSPSTILIFLILTTTTTVTLGLYTFTF